MCIILHLDELKSVSIYLTILLVFALLVCPLVMSQIFLSLAIQSHMQ